TLYRFVNQASTRRSAFETSVIPWTRHQDWFSQRYADPDTRIYVMCAGELPVGQIRFEKKSARIFIDYSVDEDFRGHGWGRRLVKLGIDMLGDWYDRTLCAEIRPENLASVRVFESLGFRRKDVASNKVVYQLGWNE
ncbi:MAG: GNAT family N-acetyltransferase, partial [Anaerolinea sp.]|nr:GNAT family N-acetyltransferase [Anaerolinea sp.]